MFPLKRRIGSVFHRLKSRRGLESSTNSPPLKVMFVFLSVLACSIKHVPRVSPLANISQHVFCRQQAFCYQMLNKHCRCDLRRFNQQVRGGTGWRSALYSVCWLHRQLSGCGGCRPKRQQPNPSQESSAECEGKEICRGDRGRKTSLPPRGLGAADTPGGDAERAPLGAPAGGDGLSEEGGH